MIRTPSRILIHAPHLLPKEKPPTAVPMVLKKATPIPANTPNGKTSIQPATWAELHLRALTHEGEDDILWLAGFSARVVGNCECRKNWRNELTILPPNFQNYFFWTVAIHNMVNVRLKKPQVTIDEARKIWTIPLAQSAHLQAETAPLT